MMTAPEVTPRRFPWRAYLIWFLAIVLFGALPLISALTGSVIAESHGCILHEGYANPCMVLGADWSETLYVMFVGGWYMFFTVPLAALGVVIWALTLIIHLLARNLQRNKPV